MSQINITVPEQALPQGAYFALTGGRLVQGISDSHTHQGVTIDTVMENAVFRLKPEGTLLFFSSKANLPEGPRRLDTSQIGFDGFGLIGVWLGVIRDVISGSHGGHSRQLPSYIHDITRTAYVAGGYVSWLLIHWARNKKILLNSGYHADPFQEHADDPDFAPFQPARMSLVTSDSEKDTPLVIDSLDPYSIRSVQLSSVNVKSNQVVAATVRPEHFSFGVGIWVGSHQQSIPIGPAEDSGPIPVLPSVTISTIESQKR